LKLDDAPIHHENDEMDNKAITRECLSTILCDFS